MLVPKLHTVLKEGYTRQQLVADVTAGLVVGVVALPLCIAFAIASGVSPERGLYTGIVAGFLISLLGGSRVQVGGPTGAFVVIVYGVVAAHGVDGLLTATLMAGVILVALGVTRLGNSIKFIPFPVVTGFTSGIALIIFSSQVKDLLGLSMGEVPADFIEKWIAFAEAIGTVSPWAVTISLATCAILVLWPRLEWRTPAPLVALLVTTAVVHFAGLPIETIGSRFGEIDASLPTPKLPSVSLSTMRELIAPAFVIAMLGGIESLLSAVVSDGMIGAKHRSNMELVAQGVANIASPIFGGIPATGAIARTATNVKNGGRTPIAGLVHAVTLLAITLFFGKMAALIPLATLAGILVIVAYQMSEWKVFRNELRGPRSDSVVLVTTFLLTVFVDLAVAIAVGMVLASLLFMKRMSEVTNVRFVTREFTDEEDVTEARPALPPGIEVYEIDGPFFFGAAEKFNDTMSQLGRKPKVLIIRMRNVPAIDSTALHALDHLFTRRQRDGTRVILAEVRSQPLFEIARHPLGDRLGEEGMTATLDEAIDEALKEVG
ncbi:MAG TPA: sulfate permease [Gemmatimonadales bacterium]|nr:sulfate permease [Gemmatimonadales bacterium]